MDKVRELIAEAEHNQWMKWARNIFDQEPISEKRRERWKDYFKPYSELSEEIKELDRKQADIILNILEKHDIIQRPANKI